MKKQIAWTCLLALALMLLPTTLEARDIMAEIEQWNSDISAANKEIKFTKMATSPFIFYRATNHLFWQDFANDERLQQFGNSKTATWLQGDLHVENMGSFCTDEEDVIFDVNDFDETMVADYQYDLWRLAVSVVLVAREHSYDEATTGQIVDTLTESYLDTLGSYCDNDDEEKIVYSVENTRGPVREFLEKVAKKKTRIKMLSKWTTDGRFNTTLEKLEAVDESFKSSFEKAWPNYGKSLSGSLKFEKEKKYFKVKDVAKRLLAGTGSLGTPRYYILIEGKSKSLEDDRILDMKRQSEPTALSFIEEQAKVKSQNPAHRHCIGYDALTKDTDDHLGYVELADGWYSIRERSPKKETYPSEELTTAEHFMALAKEWGKVVATAHARADKDFEDEIIDYQFEKKVGKLTDGKIDEFKALVRQIATDYASQVAVDWETFCQATGKR